MKISRERLTLLEQHFWLRCSILEYNDAIVEQIKFDENNHHWKTNYLLFFANWVTIYAIVFLKLRIWQMTINNCEFDEQQSTIAKSRVDN